MTIDSPAFAHNGTIPAKYTCDGEGVSPPLRVQDVTRDTVSLALIVDDPDAPGGTFTHWTVWNIDPTTTELAVGETPHGATEGMTSFGGHGYGGPCPPSGTHRYRFTLFALSKQLSLSSSAQVHELMTAMSPLLLGQATLTGQYERTR